MRCYFHLADDHDHIADDEGVEVSDLPQACADALAAIEELRLGSALGAQDWRGWRLDITDEAGLVLLSIPIQQNYTSPPSDFAL